VRGSAWRLFSSSFTSGSLGTLRRSVKLSLFSVAEGSLTDIDGA
jgi:hypothetical protein